MPVNSDGSFSHAFMLSRGANPIWIAAKDQAGNNAVDSRIIRLNLTAPALVVSAPADSSRTATSLTTVSGTMDETSTVTAKLGTDVQAASTNGSNYSADFNLAPGINTFEVTATDLAGNTNTQKRTVTYDDQKPVLVVTSPSQDMLTDQGSITISGSATHHNGAVAVVIDIDGQTYSPAVVDGQFEQTVNFTGEKPYVIVVTATSEAGAVAAVQRNVIYTSFDAGSILINGGAAATNSSSATLTLYASSGGSTVTEMQFSKDGGITWHSFEPYVTTKPAILTPSGDGIKTVAVRYKNALGAVSTAYSAAINLYTAPPTGTITINGGATATGSSTAVLTLSATSPVGISEMQFSKDGGVTWYGWEPFSTTRNVVLTPAGNGEKTVSVRYKDVLGNISIDYTDSITLDSSLPTGSIVINGGAAVTNQTTATLTLSAASPVGISKMQFSKDGGTTWYAWESYSTTRSLTLAPSGDGTKTVHVRYMDTEGKISAVAYYDSIILDTTPPTGSIVINGGAQTTASAWVTLTLSATDTNGVSQMQFSKDGVSWYPWEAYATTRAATVLLPGTGTKSFFVRYKDAAGNVSVVYSDTIEYTP